VKAVIVTSKSEYDFNPVMGTFTPSYIGSRGNDGPYKPYEPPVVEFLQYNIKYGNATVTMINGTITQDLLN
jgi:hypothetical protein